MPDVRPLRAWRYDLGRVGALADVVAPPYDVIDAKLHQALLQRHPHNIVHLDLSPEQQGDTETSNRYTRAGRLLKDWTRDGVLRQDKEPSLYVYHQTYTVEGQQYTRRGVLARVRLERFGEGKIFPHEETMPGPKLDRLRLMLATGMNLSPIFGLYPDPANAIQSKVDEAVRRALPLEAADHLGTRSQLWPVGSMKLLAELQGLFFDKPAFIADGHHRYETSLRYLDEQREAGTVKDADAPANFTLMMLVGMSDPGLLILPTHRLLSGFGAVSADKLRDILKEHFDVQLVGTGDDAARQAWQNIEGSGRQDVLGFGTVSDGVWQLARLRSPAIMAQLAKGHSPAWQGLGVSILQVLVLQHLLKRHFPQEAKLDYVHLVDEALAACAAKRCDVAALAPAATMRHVEQIAGNLEKMPPKSTYFYPKLLTGLVLNPLQ
jgi:uncharacterized protein (DUF1015 family)